MFTFDKLPEHKMTIVSIEGNIGAGKSTILTELLQKIEQSKLRRQVIILEEDLESYTKGDGVNPLEEFYKDEAQNSFSFQLLVLKTKLERLIAVERLYPDALVITERSIESDRYIFTELILMKDLWTDMEKSAYNSFFRMASRYRPDLMVHVDVDPTVCLERIAMRGRKGEDLITLDYLMMLNVLHRKMFDMDGNRAKLITVEDIMRMIS